MKKCKLLPTLLVTSLLVSAISCGGYNDNNNDYNPRQEEESQFGVFSAQLVPVNASTSSASGTAAITVENDTFSATVGISGATLATHSQHIHTGTRCPTPADDTNGDGVVDANEAAAVYGSVLVPLDSDLTSSAGVFPSGVVYSYTQSASLSTMLASLNISAINVDGLVVDVHGIPGNADIPVSCGVLVPTN